jgi:CubicO group peptidase (beta-lactamase class C family)
MRQLQSVLTILLLSLFMFRCTPSTKEQLPKTSRAILTDTINLPASDPEVTGYMRGYPLPDSMLITQQNWLIFPRNRWSFRHVRDLFPTAVSRTEQPVSPLTYAYEPKLDSLRFPDKQGHSISLMDYLLRENVDGFMVMKDGKVLYERYIGSFGEHDHHLWMSTTKSLTGLLAEILIQKGTIDPEKTAASYLPYLRGTVYGNAKIRHHLNMELNIREEVSTKAAALPAESFSGPFLEVVKNSAGVTQTGDNGNLFFYTNSEPQTVGAVMTAVTGKRWNALVEELIWSRLGAEHDGYVIADKHGQAMSAGGFNSSMRDIARFLEMIRQRGQYNGQQIVPASVIDTLMSLHDNRELFARGNVGPKRAGMSYRNYWYQVNDGDSSLELIGIFGQHHHINPRRGITIVQLSSNREPGGDGIDYGLMISALTKLISK